MAALTRSFGGVLASFSLLVGLFIVAVALRARARRGPALGVGLLVSALLATACRTPVESGPEVTSRPSALWEIDEVIYFHGGLSAGPQLLTREDGSVFEERRYEPFGAPIDAYREPANGGPPDFGSVDFAAEPLNILNKETEPVSGYSYHGARWMSPHSATWLTPDPPVKGPDPKFLAEPWDLHPYQYVSQNPILYWDPDGRVKYIIDDRIWQLEPGESPEHVAKQTGFTASQIRDFNPQIDWTAVTGSESVNVPQTTRIKVFQEAANRLYDPSYGYDGRSPPMPPGTDKCNKYVSDVVYAAGGVYPDRFSWRPDLWPASVNTLRDVRRFNEHLPVLSDGEEPLPGDLFFWPAGGGRTTGHTAVYGGAIKMMFKGIEVREFSFANEKGYQAPGTPGFLTASGKMSLYRSEGYMREAQYLNEIVRRPGSEE